MFTHQRIKGNEIRLLQVSPLQGDVCLCFVVKTFLRGQCPPYFALSYVWGQGEATKTIQLDEKTFKIRSNLYSFLGNVLHHVRTRFAKGTFVQGGLPKVSSDDLIYIWVDAVCIDQNNVVERNDQVRQMDKIFSQAISVLCWLGEEHIEDFPDTGGDDPSSLSPPEQPPKLKHSTFEVMESYTNSAYWRRMWVVQEFWLAQSSVVLAPNFCVGEKDFLKLYQTWSAQQRQISKALNSAKNDSGPTAQKKVRIWRGTGPRPVRSFLRRMHNRASEPLSLDKLLCSYHDRSCLDERDKVFAALGLLNREQRLAIGRYLPNYELDYHDVLVVALATIIEFSHMTSGEWSRLRRALGERGGDWRDLLNDAVRFQTLFPAKNYTNSIIHRSGSDATRPESTETIRYSLHQARLGNISSKHQAGD